ncbi:hypothetical protein DEO72_LG8g2302 [Vigna unguiculata]|uniref:Uncharacterized protein n=1 Tax=Vigna unguiculata TaxID=3917 RepID=A0A4D6MWJ7_VIGUN|nr:hypothetical protein DEO72_LG8g2302 [Vigna unguiculata]
MSKLPAQQLNHHHRACSNNSIQNTIKAPPWKQRTRTITPEQLQQQNSSENTNLSDLHCVQPFSDAAAHHLAAAITIESSSSRCHHNH